jgi:hypothetical protein
VSTAGELHPTDGIRLLLILDAADGERAVYAASVYTPDAAFEYRATLATDGSAELEVTGQAATPEHEKRLRNLATSTARAAARKIADGLVPWPPRILRWRADS